MIVVSLAMTDCMLNLCAGISMSVIRPSDLGGRVTMILANINVSATDAAPVMKSTMKSNLLSEVSIAF